jgi:hypothetical protein
MFRGVHLVDLCLSLQKILGLKTEVIANGAVGYAAAANGFHTNGTVTLLILISKDSFIE